jgi:cytoskeletal protein CcmA (bactofilin family)
MFGKKKDTDQDQSIPKSTEEPKLTDDSEKGFGKEVGSGKELRMAEGKLTSLTSDADIKGTIKFGEALRIDGKFDGELITENGELVVGKTGKVKANVKVRSAVVEGRVDGNIKASDKVELKQSAHIFGDLQAKTLIVEQGVIFVGNCNVNPEGTKIESQSFKEEIKGGIKEDIRHNRLVNV